MHKPQEQVRDFHRACNLTRSDYPNFGDWLEQAGVRLDLIKEEVQELDDAIQAKDRLEVIDALCDILYVVYGYAVSIGVDLEPFFEEVQRANMEKASGPKREDGKQLKPGGWRGPDHRSVFRRVYNCDPH